MICKWRWKSLSPAQVETAAVVNFAGILSTSDYQRLEIWNNLNTFYQVLMAFVDNLTNTLIYVRAHSNMRSQDNISTPTINSWSIYSLHILTAVSEQDLGQFTEQRE